MGLLTTTLPNLENELLFLTKLRGLLEIHINELGNKIEVDLEPSKKISDSIKELIPNELSQRALHQFINAISTAQKETLSHEGKIISKKLIIKTIKRLQLETERCKTLFKKNDEKKTLTHLLKKIDGAKNEIIEEKKLAPYKKSLKTALKKEAKDSANLLTLISVRAILLVHKKGLTNTQSGAHTIMRNYYNALHNLVKEDIKSKVDSVDRITFWLNVLCAHDYSGDIHSLIAIYAAIDSLRSSLSSDFERLKSRTKKLDRQLTNKYQDLVIYPINLIEFYNTHTIIVPYLGSYESLLNSFKEINRTSQNVLDFFNFITTHVEHSKLDAVIKAHIKTPEHAQQLLTELIAEIPESNLPIFKSKAIQERREHVQNEFNLMILSKHQEQLISLERLKQFIEKESKSISFNEEALKLMIDKFDDIMPQANEFWQKHAEALSLATAVTKVIESIDLAFSLYYTDESSVAVGKGKNEATPRKEPLKHGSYFFGTSKKNKKAKHRSYQAEISPLHLDEAHATSSASSSSTPLTQTPKSV